MVFLFSSYIYIIIIFICLNLPHRIESAVKKDNTKRRQRGQLIMSAHPRQGDETVPAKQKTKSQQ